MIWGGNISFIGNMLKLSKIFFSENMDPLDPNRWSVKVSGVVREKGPAATIKKLPSR